MFGFFFFSIYGCMGALKNWGGEKRVGEKNLETKKGKERDVSV